jgi:nucleoside-diphosphate kinase
VLLKPDAVERRLVGRIIERFEAKGLAICALKMMPVSEALARKQYAVHQGKPFYEPLVRFISSGPIVAIVIEGRDAIAVVRKLVGATFGCNAEPGTVRGDFAISNRFNLVHASDSVETAAFEIPLYFAPEEIIDRKPSDLNWLYDFSEGGQPV